MSNAYQALLAVGKAFVEEDYAQAIDLYAELDANAVDDDTYKEMYQSIKEQMENHLNDRISRKRSGSVSMKVIVRQQ